MKNRVLKVITLVIVFAITGNCLFAQNEYESGKIWVIVNHDSVVPSKGHKASSAQFNLILQDFNITNVKQIMPFAKTKQLRMLYELVTPYNEDALFSKLEQLNKNENLFFSIEKCPLPKMLYDPADYMWWLTLNDNSNNDNWLWYLKKIEANKAWDITKGDPNVKVAVIDNGIDPLHPDLIGKIDPPYNFYLGTPFNPQSHGTSVATILAAETVDQGQNSNGQMASIGYNTKIMFAEWDLSACVYASTVMEAKIISISWTSSCLPSTTMLLAEQEILNNGTSIIRAAGNGNLNCGGQRLYPFSGYEDERTIVVTSAGLNDQHYNGTNTNSHYPSVDVCAPGYSIMGGTSTDNGTNSYPYFGSWGGTSQSTPIVSGIAALILSVNKCLEPQDIQTILKNSTDPITDAANYPGTVGAGRVNAYKSVLMATTYGINSPISTNTIWATERFIKGNLIIEQGTTLTITDIVRFSEDSKVIIKQGAKLIVDGGTLTNSKGCNQYWRGIEVWGTSNQHQYPANGSTYQGTLILKNGGTIENAHTAAVNWKQDDFSKIGGIIQATDGVFKNNRRDVAFMSYSNFLASNPSIKVPNLSFFKNTDFVSDDNFIEKGYAIQSHVTMWEVSGINFSNCHFSNNITTVKNNSTAPNRGIYSSDAAFKVFAGCNVPLSLGQTCPTASVLKSSFSGFSTAVEITGASTTQTATIQQSVFSNNINGIVVNEIDNVSLNRNEISIGNAGYVLGAFKIGSGINLSNSTGYIIEENKVSTNLTSGYYSGINVNNSGENANKIYKNTLENLTIATNASGVNHNSDYSLGLQFLCNTYKNCATAIQIQSSAITHGVRLYQGDFLPNKSAGNTFVNNTKSIVNNANGILYYFNGVNSQPLNYTGLVTANPATTANACPTSFGSGGVIMRPPSLLLNDLGDLTEEYNDLQYTYVSLIDGGNTEQFKNNIEINWSDDAWQLRGKLIEKSPYLSSEVLLKVAGQNILPNGMLLEVLLANPDATRTESFIENLRNETNNSFPEYMINYVKNNWDVKTLRTNIEGEISSIHSELAVTRNYIKYLEKSEEEYTLADRLNTMKIGNSLSHKVGLMDFFIESNQFAKADSVLQAVMNDKTMKDELQQIDYYEDYLFFRSSLDGRNLAQLDSNEINYLQTLAENSGRAAGYAQNILCFFYDICYEEQFDNGDIQSKSMSIATNTAELENIMYNITVYPNPSEEFTSIKWEIYDQLQNAHYKVFDLNGNEVASSLIDNNKGEKVIDTRSLRNGIYIIGVYNNDEVKANKKLVVNHQK